MCGIAVVLRLPDARLASASAEQLLSAAAHRGPDAEGIAYFQVGRQRAEACRDREVPWTLALGHRRLSILDLSDEGRQPMSYGDALWITYNGEVYNYLELRQELERAGDAFRSHTDTEVILAAYRRWGPACFEKLSGMWALAIADLERGELILSRDRLGIKPMYLLRTSTSLMAASEIKQFAEVHGVELKPREDVLCEYLLTGYERLDATFFEQVEPVRPGVSIVIDLKTGTVVNQYEYWHPERAATRKMSRAEAAHTVCDSLYESTRIHMRSDVPVGCALSGGLDSSAVAASMVRFLEPNVRLQTFTVAFPGRAVDESRYATLVARHVRAMEHVTSPTATDLLDEFDAFVYTHDEPVGSLSQYAGFALARLARSANVPVVLNGQGGDEALLGYWQSYFSYLWGRLRRGDAWTPIKHVLGAMLPGGNGELLRQIPVMWNRYRARTAGRGISLPSLERRNGDAARTRIGRILQLGGIERRLCELRELYLPRLLKWDDRNFMAFSVEGRYPFLDHHLLEAVLTCPDDMLYRSGWLKEPLRQGLESQLPQEIVRRRTKSGFETPQDEWLRELLRPTVDAMLQQDMPIWNFVDRTEAKRLAERVCAASSPTETEASQVMVRMILANHWLRVFFGDRREAARAHARCVA